MHGIIILIAPALKQVVCNAMLNRAVISITTEGGVKLFNATGDVAIDTRILACVNGSAETFDDCAEACNHQRLLHSHGTQYAFLLQTFCNSQIHNNIIV